MRHDVSTRNPVSSQASAGLSEVGMKYFPTYPTKPFADFAKKKKRKRIWTQDITVLSLNQHRHRRVRGKGKVTVEEEPPSEKKIPSLFWGGERGLGQSLDVHSLLEISILGGQAAKMEEKLLFAPCLM